MRSYTRRFSGSESTSQASESSLNTASASASPGFLPGWDFSAILRSAFLISGISASRATPRMS